MDNKIKVLFFILISFIYSYSYAELKVYYIPLNAETYVPVNTDNIEEQAHYIFNTKDNKLIKIFDEALVQNNKLSLKTDLSNLTNVRVKIISAPKKEVMYFDNMSKVYVENSSVDRSLSSKVLTLIEKVIANSCIKKAKVVFLKKEKCK